MEKDYSYEKEHTETQISIDEPITLAHLDNMKKLSQITKRDSPENPAKMFVELCREAMVEKKFEGPHIIHLFTNYPNAAALRKRIPEDMINKSKLYLTSQIKSATTPEDLTKILESSNKIRIFFTFSEPLIAESQINSFDFMSYATAYLRLYPPTNDDQLKKIKDALILILAKSIPPAQ